ncbi:MAG: hypothetical protein KJ686_10235, partial [Actinobacteria bacterium]|nr:hypothetical protein [Actinomycetota bacterium]
MAVFTMVPPAPTAQATVVLAADIPFKPCVVVDVWAVGELRAIIGTTNGGTNWNVRATIPHSGALYGVDFPAAADGFAVGSGGTIVKTSNSGVTWAAQNSTTTNGLNGISAASTTVAWAVGAGGPIVKTA